MDLKNKCVLIAGSSGLIGRSLTSYLLENTDYAVVGLDVLPSGTHNDKFKEFNGSVLDLTFLRQVSNWIEESSAELAGVVTCIATNEFNNSAQTYADLLENKFPQLPKRTLGLLAAWSEYPQLEATKAFEINCLGANNVVSSLVENLLSSATASVVHVCSQYGLKTPRQELFDDSSKFLYKPLAYPISKAALLMLSEYQASLFAGTNVRVNAISPGAVMQGQPAQFQTKYSIQTWSRSMLNVQDLLRPIEFLLSDGSRYMNGANLVVDGGWSRN